MLFSYYVLKETIVSFLMALVAFTLMLFVGNSLRFLAEQVPLMRFVRALPYLFVYLLSFTTSMALLTAVVFTFGRMGMDNEFTAIRASGVSLRIVVLPVFILALVLSLLSLPLNSWIAPNCHYKAESIMIGDASDINIQWSDRYEPTIRTPTTTVYIGEQDGEIYRDIFICETENGKPSRFIAADTATLQKETERKEIIFRLSDGAMYDVAKGVDEAGDPVYFRNNTFVMEIPSAGNLHRGTREWHIKDLRRMLKNKEFPEYKIPKVKTEIHKRISISFSCLALVLVGVPMGMLTKRGNFVAAFGASVGVIFVLYYPLLLVGEVLGNMGKVPPIISMWAANVLTAAIGVVLLIQTRKA